MREPNARERRRLEQIAFHQAGHAVAAHALGVDFDGVSVFPDEFEHGEHLPLVSPDIEPDVHIKILLAGAESCRRFATSQRGSAQDSRGDRAQFRALEKRRALNRDEAWARVNALLPWVTKLFARPANQAAVGAVATALLASGRLDGQRARAIIREARNAARRGGVDGPASLRDILPELIAAVPAPTRRNGAYTAAQRRQLNPEGPLKELLQQGEQADVPAAWASGTNPGRRYPKRCLDRSWSYVLDHGSPPDLAGGMRLVLGLVSLPLMDGIPFRHAWVELPNEVVFDGVVQTFFTRQSYYRVMGALAQQSFTRAETLDHIKEGSDFGFNDPQYTSVEAVAAYLRRFGRSLKTRDTQPVQEPAPPN